MGWVEALQGELVALDTAPLIYFIEEHPIYAGASTLLTNDIRWPALPDLHILTLDSLV